MGCFQAVSDREVLPKIVVTCVRDEFVPRRQFPVEIFCVRVRERAEAKIKIVDVEAVKGKTEVLVRGFEQGGVFERVAEAKGAVVEEVVAEPSVAHAGLFGDGLERGMRVDHSHGDEKAVIGNAVEADAAVVVRDIFHEPVDGVVGVRAFVHTLGIARVMQRAKHDELPFGAVAPANILKREDVTIRNHVGVTIDQAADPLVRGGDSIRSSFMRIGNGVVAFFGV